MAQALQMTVLTLPGLIDISVALAATRGGGLGVLDLEYTQNQRAALDAIGRLARYAGNEFGIKLNGDEKDFLVEVTADLPDQLRVVILTSRDPRELQEQVHVLHRKQLTILLEATSLEQARIGAEIGVNGLIAKGNEAGGRIGEETTFILLQQFLTQLSLPIWAQGGVGLHTAAACYAAGAAGIVLDAQLALTRESSLSEMVKARITAMDGSETVCLGKWVGETYRAYFRPGSHAIEELRQVEKLLADDERPQPEILTAWRRAVLQWVGWDSPEQNMLLLGQDAAFAAPLAQRFYTVEGVLEEFRQAIHAHYQAARRRRPLGEGSALAQSHKTRYPIVQGPMTRVSDTAEFAAHVAGGGALPFLALALMQGQAVKTLLEETQRRLRPQPWGVGILGFVPPELRQEQLDVIRAYRPPFALIAGGRPDQARALEQEGIPTYLHVPSPGLLSMFLQDGARRFVFEGRECGGHVGPRSSFVLWDQMIDVLLKFLASDPNPESYHILFAAGIHDALSASMVAIMAAPLAEREVRLGVLMGTAYVFTEEAVTSGAITKGFQEEVLRCERTALLETGPGHSTRCAVTPYVKAFEAEKRRLARSGISAEEVRLALENLNLGRLRIASKGIARHPHYGQMPQAPRFVTLNEGEQRAKGMYMIGQVAALRNQVSSIESLHRDVAVEGSKRLEALPEDHPRVPSTGKTEQSSNIAIIGMACLLPKAMHLQAYWENILNKIDAITEVPKERWDWKLYYDPNPKAEDKVYSKWGGFIEDIPFDPMQYGIPPNTLPSIEPAQLLTLEVVHAALKDSGYLDRSFPREQTSVILGTGGGAADLGLAYSVRSFLPTLDALPGLPSTSRAILSRLNGVLPEWTEDSFSGILTNVSAGRVANRFDLGGVNYTVDAACASSLAAVSLAVRELEQHTSDMVIVGGVDTMQSPFIYLCFSKTHALSPRGRCRTFDESADGIVISEGIAIMVLKRLADAERDEDRIYAVIKSVGASSDGRDKGLTAPRPEGQARALQRAYTKANVSPETVGLIEAHGTGTIAGDQAEVQALTRVFTQAQAKQQICAIGSVKSMIGHTKCTAGVAGLMKVALALYHKVLPPTLGVEKPNPKVQFPETPFYVNTEPRPWICSVDGHPRRAGVNAFGFGGTNFHAVVEEYPYDPSSSSRSASQQWPSELLLWRGDSRQVLAEAIAPLEKALTSGAKPVLRDLAYTLWKSTVGKAPADEIPPLRLAIVAASLEDLKQKLVWAREALTTSRNPWISDPRGIYFAEQPLAREAKVAFLFPGQGSQYPNMLRNLALQFPEVRACFERADQVLARQLAHPLSAYIFPPPTFDQEEARACQQALTQTNIAQPAIGAADIAMFRLLESLGVRPDFIAGHSYGEYVALSAAGVFNEDVLIMLSEARGRFIVDAAGAEPGTMAAVEADVETVSESLHGIEGVSLANLNAPNQTVISGAQAAIEQAVKHLQAQSLRARLLPVACAFHSPIVAPAQGRLAEFLSTVKLSEPRVTVYCNTTAAPYPKNPQAIAAQLVEHLVRPVEFAQEIEALYAVGARIFVEVGPRNVLTSLVDQILRDRPRLVLASDQTGRSGLVQLHHLLGQLAVHHVPLKLDRLYSGRSARLLDLERLEIQTGQKELPHTTWLVNGGRAKPLKKAAAPSYMNRQGEAPPSLPPPQPMPSALDQAPDPVPMASLNAPVTPSSSAESAVQVMERFEQVMARIVEAQRNVMLAYLQGVSGADAPIPLSQPTLVPAGSLAAVPLQSPELTPQEGASAGSSEEPTTWEASASPSHQAAEPPDREQLASRFLAIVSERTGYPPEMLSLDLNLEADLGIDSIKRVEILGNFQQSLASTAQKHMEGMMESLAGTKTLRGIIGWIIDQGDSKLEPKGPKLDILEGERQELSVGEPATEVPPGIDQDAQDDSMVQRYTLTAIETPLKGRPATLIRDRVVLLTDDEQDIAQTLADELRGRGCVVALVRLGQGAQEISQGSYTADLTSPGAVAQLLDIVRYRQGPIGGIIHLLPLKRGISFEEMDFAGWMERLRVETKSLFYLTKSLSEDLKEAARGEGACLMVATGMGGTFAHGHSSEVSRFLPGQGGILGLVKTLALEWPTVRCKVVDLDLENSTSTLAEQLFQEIAEDDGQVEVGYQGLGRWILQPRLAPLDQGGLMHLSIDSDWVLLVTGGARGITAEVVCELAERYRPTLLLVGRSPLPGPEEPPETVALTSPQELKNALVDQMRQKGEPITLARVEAGYNRLLRDREIRRNLTRMQRAGAKVRYYQADVREEQALANLIEGIYREYGRLDGTIHGAGIIEDKLIEDKAPESFDRVFDTKAASAFILSRALRADSLKFLVLFSSVAGLFGNRGQCDYAAANGVLNQMAIHLDKSWPGRVVSINWGPWATTGMVSLELRQQFAKRGVQLISIPAGRRIFDRELRYGLKGKAEVIVADGVWKTTEASGNATASPVLPLLHRAMLSIGSGDIVEVVRVLDPSHDLYLRDHQLDSRPVLPVAMAVELMVEVVQQGWPDLEVVGLRDLHVLRGVVLENGPKTVRLTARAQAEPHREALSVNINVEITDPERHGYPHYRATVELANKLSGPQPYQLPFIDGLQSFPMTVDEAYRQWLFHGPIFQGIAEIQGISERGMVATCLPSSPRQCLAEDSCGQWLIDPVIFDSGLQMVILWARAQHDVTPLPSRFQRYRRFGSLNWPVIRCQLQANATPGRHVIDATLFFVGAGNRLLGVLEHSEWTSSKALNHLAGPQLRG